MPTHAHKPFPTLATSISNIEHFVVGHEKSRTITSRSVVLSRITADTFHEHFFKDKTTQNVILKSTFMSMVAQRQRC